MKLVCIPAWNEEKSIEKIVKNSLIFSDMVIVCDDGSVDNTAKIAKENGAYIISHKRNLGYGAAITSLFNYAKKENADLMITLDADNQHNPKEIPSLVNALIEKNVDIIIGSRFLNKNSNISFIRKFGIKIISFTSNMGTTFKIKDSQSGFRVYSKRAIQSINLTEKGMSASTEILIKASDVGLTLSEKPITVYYDEISNKNNLLFHGFGVFFHTLKFVLVKHLHGLITSKHNCSNISKVSKNQISSLKLN